MSQDANNQPAVEKFSFIYTLTYSRSASKNTEPENNHQSLEAKSISPESTKSSRQEKPRELEIPQSGNSDSVTFSSLITPSILGSSSIFSESEQFQQLSISVLNLSPELITQQENNQIKKEGDRTYFDKILFIFACSYLIFVAWWLLSSQLGHFSLFFWQNQQQLSLQESTVERETRLLNYLDQALTLIERKTESQQKQQTKTNNTSDGSTPQMVYIPVYASGNTFAGLNTFYNNSPLPIPLPQGNSETFLTQAIAPPPPPTEFREEKAIKTIASQSASETTTVTEKTPAPPSSATTATVLSSSEEVTTTSAVSGQNTPQPNLPNYILVGLLELGEQSAALFQVKGTTKKILLGEAIDNTGWTIESIANQKVSISRQGEVRSLSIGEQF